MKPGIPWSVKGIEPEVREAAKHAARRSGMTLGEWLNSAILGQAEDAGSHQMAPAAAPEKEIPERRSVAHQPPRYPSETTVRLEDIAQQLSQLARREQESAAIMPYEAPSRDHDTLNRILNRVESNERQTVEAFTAVNERLSVLGRQIAMASRTKTFEKPEDVPGFTSLETAIRNVVDHIELGENRTRDTLKSMQDRLSEMASRAAAAPSDDILRTAPSFVALESRLSEIAGRLQHQEAQAQAGLPKLMRDELTKLASRIDEASAAPAYAELQDRVEQIGHRLQQQEVQIQGGMPRPVRDEIARLASRIDEVRAASQGLAREAQTQAVASAQKELRDIEQRIHGLLRDAQAAVSSQGVNAADVTRLRSEMGALNRHIDEQLAAAASEQDVQALRVAVEQLSTRVAQGPDPRPLADLDRRLAEIANRVERVQSESRNPPHLAELNRRIGEIDQQLQDVISQPREPSSVAALEHQLAAFNDRLARTEEQLGHFGNIERAITQLYDAMEHSKDTVRQTAEDAANRAAERALQQHAAAIASGGPSPELRALQDGLKAVRQSAEASDQRSQETLAAVHETLEQIVGKLAELETSAAGHQLAMSMAQQATAAPATPLAAAAHPLKPAPDQRSEAHFPEPPAPAPEDEFFDPMATFAEPAPLHAAASPPVVAAPAAAPEPEAPPQPPAAAPAFQADDYIAAARRLAMAANIPSAQAPLAAGPRPADKASPARRFKLPFEMPKLQRKPKPMTFSGGKLVTEADAAPAKPMSRRTLIVVGIALLVAAGLFGMRMMAKSAKPVKQVSAIEQTVAPSNGPAQGITSVAPAAVQPSAAATTSIPSTAEDLVTGSLPARKTEASLTAIVAQPGAVAADKPDIPPDAIGSQDLRDAAARGNAKAQFVIASRYLDGQYVQQDFTRAAYWYQQAATRGLAPAEYRIGTLFERGRGVPQDVATALVWYERAAEAGNVKAMHNAAVIAAGNQAGTPNYDKAFRWFSEAAKHGLKDSQYNLAVLYERGLGSKPDAGEAYFWYRLAAKQGDSDAASRADLLKKALTPATTAAVEARIAAWQPLPNADDANVVAVTQPGWNAPADAMVSPDDGQPQAAPQPQTQSQAPAAAPTDLVKTIQQLLQKLGYNVGTPDGKMGARTASAIRLFQLQSGMKVTGEVSSELISEMQAKAAG